MGSFPAGGGAAQGYMSEEHFTVDGTLIEAWASQKSFQPKQGGPAGDGGNFHGQQRRNDTHASTSDPDSRLYPKSQGSEARLAYLGHVLMENRHGLIADAMVTQADGDAERDAARTIDASRAMEEAAATAPYRGRRQSVRHQRFCADGTGDAGHSPCITERGAVQTVDGVLTEPSSIAESVTSGETSHQVHQQIAADRASSPGSPVKKTPASVVFLQTEEQSLAANLKAFEHSLM